MSSTHGTARPLSTAEGFVCGGFAACIAVSHRQITPYSLPIQTNRLRSPIPQKSQKHVCNSKASWQRAAVKRFTRALSMFSRRRGEMKASGVCNEVSAQRYVHRALSRYHSHIFSVCIPGKRLHLVYVSVPLTLFQILLNGSRLGTLSPIVFTCKAEIVQDFMSLSAGR